MRGRFGGRAHSVSLSDRLTTAVLFLLVAGMIYRTVMEPPRSQQSSARDEMHFEWDIILCFLINIFSPPPPSSYIYIIIFYFFWKKEQKKEKYINVKDLLPSSSNWNKFITNSLKNDFRKKIFQNKNCCYL